MSNFEVANDRLARLHRRLYLSKESLDPKSYQKFRTWLYGIEVLQKEAIDSTEVLAASSHWEQELNALQSKGANVQPISSAA